MNQVPLLGKEGTGGIYCSGKKIPSAPLLQKGGEKFFVLFVFFVVKKY